MLAFQESPTSYLLAWEDLPIPTGDGDFQDMVLRLENGGPANVPEPGTLFLLVSGLFFQICLCGSWEITIVGKEPEIPTFSINWEKREID